MSLWVDPSFGESIKYKEGEVRSVGRNESVAGARKGTHYLLKSIWSEEYAPKKKEDLAVNNKKIQEVESWLARATSGALGKAPIVVLSGPSGSGKTATLQILSKSLHVTIKEWGTPLCNIPVDLYEDFPGRGKYRQPSQSVQFEEFLFRASRYVSVYETVNPDRCILLVEDIPNVYIKEPTLFEKALRKYSVVGRSPLVFICSSGSTEFNIDRILFNPKMKGELSISNISFNPVSRTLMIKAVERVIELGRISNPGLFDKISMGMIESMIDISNSDIRFTVNQLQYVCCDGTGASKTFERTSKIHSTTIKSKGRGRGKKKMECVPVSCGGKDQFSDVFRCVGRVLYCKKEVVIDEKTNEVKERLIYDPVKIVNTMYSAPNLFMNLLNENYVTIFNDIKNIAKAGIHLAQTDILMSMWNERDSALYYALYLSSFGLMNISNDDIQRKWNPFRGSKLKEILSSYDQKKNRCRELFPQYGCNTNTLLTEILPFLSKMGLSMLSDEQQRFVISASNLSSSRIRTSFLEEVEEPDGSQGLSLEPKTTEALSIATIHKEIAAPSCNISSDEEVIIEDCDSDA